MHIFLRPEDVLLFRDGRPFNAGADHHARSVFPPLPSVMQGAIRSHYLVYEGVPLNDKEQIEETVGTADDYKSLRLRGPFLAKYANGNVVRYFPTPADAFVMDEEGRTVQEGILKKANSGFHSHPDLSYLVYPPEGWESTKKGPGLWMSENQLAQYFKGEVTQTTAESDLFVRETRLGIKLEAGRSRASEEGMLYQAEFIRPCDGVGLYLEVDGYEWPENGLMRIGGEGHGVYFSEVDAPENKFPICEPLWPRFKIYFATPAYFEDGWRPKDWGKFFEGKVTLEGVALSGSLVSSGFDYAKGKAKSARRFVPAGSVYYFSNPGKARLKTINGMSEYAAEIGFGQILITEWKEK